MNEGTKYVFICGLHRSGTTLLARELAKLKDCTGFESTGVTMDEGQYLQNVYPVESVFGGVGRFGFVPQAHMREDSPLLTPANVTALRRSWERYWDEGKPVRIEKTPSNILKTRFLQAAFPDAYFIVMKRHPVAVSLATRKWRQNSLIIFFEHWLRCHEIFDEDKKHLRHLYELSYEDFVRDPKKHLEEIARFLGTEVSGAFDVETLPDLNQQYWGWWDEALERSHLKWFYLGVARMFEEKFRKHGYSLLRGRLDAALADDGTFFQRMISPLLRWGAKAYTALWLLDLRFRLWARRLQRRLSAARD